MASPADEVTILKTRQGSRSNRERLCSEHASDIVNAASTGDLELLKKSVNILLAAKHPAQFRS